MQLLFQPTGPSITLLSTTSASGFATMQISGYCTLEITTIGSNGAFVHVTDGPVTAQVAATTTDRVVPGNSTLYQYCPQGVAFVSAIAQSAAGPAVIITPGRAINSI